MGNRQRWLVGAILLGIVVGLFGSVVKGDTGFTQAGLGEPTYLISDVAMSSSQDPTQIGITFRYDWNAPTYPGPAKCRFELTGAAGTIVGVLDVQLDSLVPTAVPARPLLVPVSATAVAATGSCAAALRPDPASGYALSAIAIVREEGNEAIPGSEPKLVATANWVGGSPPGTQHCVLTAVLLGGTPGACPDDRGTWGGPSDHRYATFVRSSITSL